MSNKNDLQTLNAKYASLIDALKERSLTEPNLQEKTIIPTTSEQTVSPDSGYDGLSEVTVEAIPTTTQATPSIEVSTTGLITATATQTAGYVTEGTKSATKQMTTQAAKTITPSTLDQIAINSGIYATGAVTVKGDANLVAANIVNGKTIFGITGTATSGGGDTTQEDVVVGGTLTTYTNDRVTSVRGYAFYNCITLMSVAFSNAIYIGNHAFHYCSNLTTVSLPAAIYIESYAFNYCCSLTTVSLPTATSIGNYAFAYCSNLTTVSLPAATSTGSNAFAYCAKLTTVNLPAATSIGSHAFRNCINLTSVSFPKATTIGSYAFNYCTKLSYIHLLGSSVCTLAASNAIPSTFTGTIYVPASLYTQYREATNWTYFSSRIIPYSMADL